jgi:signal transduction histidine kinase
VGSPISVDLRVTGYHEKLPDDVEQNVLRIAQEAVANTLKHAHARRIWIRLELGRRRLVLSVKDDGRGFDPAGAFATLDGHFGLLGMRERARRVGGDLDLSSHPGEGTQVTATVPLPLENHYEGTRWRRFWNLLRAPLRPVRS